MTGGRAESVDEMDRPALALWAADCAERVLSLFEDRYLDDRRPREAVEAARAWARGEISVGVARTAAFAAHAAATAHVADHARHAAAYAAAASARIEEPASCIDRGSRT